MDKKTQHLDLGVSVECMLEALEITMSSNNGKFVINFFTQINGATIRGPESASVTHIFGAVYIDPTGRDTGMTHLILGKTQQTKR